MKKEAGILMPIASLPNKYGIGDFGPETYKFIDELAKSPLTYWQILPLNRLSYGNSPYQPLSSHAIDEIYISLDLLAKEGLIKSPKPYKTLSDRVDYDQVRKYKEIYCIKAYHVFVKKGLIKRLAKFQKDEPFAYPYARFIAHKKLNDLRPWQEWTKFYQDEEIKDAIQYEVFLQYVAFKQWKRILNRVRRRGLKLIGDIPFYVGFDSDDVYYHREQFLIDENNNPKLVAGVPPDYFSKSGQLWGNPIYNFMKMRETGYSFYIERMKAAFKMCDVLRIDHFRAFDSYYVIPFGRPDAVVGEWWDGPAYDFFEFLKQEVDLSKIIAEDLGDLRPSVLVLRDYYFLPGMDVTQFTVSNLDNKELENMVAYTGTHDNQTVVSWFQDNTLEHQNKVRNILKDKLGEEIANLPIHEAMLHFTLAKNARIAIIPTQDLLGLDDFYRINVPNTVNNINWAFRIKTFKEMKKALDIYSPLIIKYGRSR